MKFLKDIIYAEILRRALLALCKKNFIKRFINEGTIQNFRREANIKRRI